VKAADIAVIAQHAVTVTTAQFSYRRIARWCGRVSYQSIAFQSRPLFVACSRDCLVSDGHEVVVHESVLWWLLLHEVGLMVSTGIIRTLVQAYAWARSTVMGSGTCLATPLTCWTGMISRSIIFITNIQMNGLIIVDISILSLLPWLTVACAGVWLGQQHIDVVWYMPGNAVEMPGRYDITWYYFYYEYSFGTIWSLLMHGFCHCCHDSLWLVQG